MKKVMLMAVMAIIAIANVKAEDAESANAVSNVVEAQSITYNFRVRLRDMNKAMGLDADQCIALQKITQDLSRRVARLERLEVEDQQVRIREIVRENLASVHEVVNDSQYHAYLTLLNLEFNRTGLIGVLYGYEIAKN